MDDPDDDTKCMFISEWESSSMTAIASLMFFRLPFYEKVSKQHSLQEFIKA